MDRKPIRIQQYSFYWKQNYFFVNFEYLGGGVYALKQWQQKQSTCSETPWPATSPDITLLDFESLY